MIDLEKERGAFEKKFHHERNEIRVEFDNKPEFYDFIDDFDSKDSGQLELLNLLNANWWGWLTCAKAKQAEIDALKAKIAELEKPKVCVYTATKSDLLKDSGCGDSAFVCDIKDYCQYCGGKVEVQ